MPTLASLFSKSGFLKWDGAGNTSSDFTTENETDLAGDTAFTGAFGQVLPAASGGDDTTALQAILDSATGQVIRGRPGASYSIDTPLVIGSGTTLDMRDCTVTLAASSNCRMLENTSVGTTQRSVADGAITSGDQTLTSATAAFTSADVGRTVRVAAAAANSDYLVANITSVTDASTVELSVAAGATVSGAAVSIYDRDEDIHIIGGTWDKGANGGTTTLDQHVLMFRRVDGITVRDATVTSTAGKFAVALGDCTDFDIDYLHFETDSDGVHITGPAANGRIAHITGTTGDDSVALTSTDYPNYDDVVGAITNVEISDVHTSNETTSVRVSGSQHLDGIIVRNVSNSGTGYALAFPDDTGNLDIGTVVAENIDGKVYAQDGTIESLVLRGWDWTPSANNLAGFVLTNTAVDRMRVENLHGDTGGNTTGNHVLYLDGTTQVGRLTVEGADWRGQSGSIVTIAAAGAGVTTCKMEGCYRDGISSSASFVQATTAGSTLTTLLLSDCHQVNAAWIADLNTTTAVFINGLTTTGGGFNVRSSGVVTVRPRGLVCGASTNAGTLTFPDDQVWIPAGRFSNQSGSPSLLGTTGPSAVQGYLLDAAAFEQVVTMELLPASWKTFDVDLYWLNEGAGSGDVRWRIGIYSQAAGASTHTSVSDTSATVTASAQDVMVKTTHVSGVTQTSGVPYRVGVARDGANVADTLANDVSFVGLMLRRAT